MKIYHLHWSGEFATIKMVISANSEQEVRQIAIDYHIKENYYKDCEEIKLDYPYEDIFEHNGHPIIHIEEIEVETEHHFGK